MAKTGQLKVLRQLSEYEFGVELWVMREGVNRNRWDYRNLDRCFSSFVGTPILCAFPNGKCGDGHNMKEKVDANGYSYYSFIDGTSERIVGTLSDDLKDFRVEEVDGEKWLVAKGRLFAFYAKELVDNIVANGVMEVSAETEVRSSYEEGDIEVFTDWVGLGVTILGEGVAPAIPNARIKEMAALRDEFNSVCLKAASYKGNDCGADNECGDNECKDDKCDNEEAEGDVIEESDEVPDETENKPQNKDNKGVKNMTLSKKQLAELAPKFEGYTVLAAEQDENGVHVCLMAHEGTTAVYEMESTEDVVTPAKIKKCNSQVCFSFGALDVKVDAYELTDVMSANVTRANAELEKANNELAQAKDTITAMKNAEDKRRVNAAKEIAQSTLTAFNENRTEKVSEDILTDVLADVEAGLYTNSVDADGNWTGDSEVQGKVLAKCAASVMEMDKAAAVRNNSQFIWDKVSHREQSHDDGSIGGLLASLNI